MGPPGFPRRKGLPQSKIFFSRILQAIGTVTLYFDNIPVADQVVKQGGSEYDCGTPCPCSYRIIPWPPPCSLLRK